MEDAIPEYWYERADPSVFERKRVVEQARALLMQLHTSYSMGPIDQRSLSLVAEKAHMFAAWSSGRTSKQPRGTLVGLVTLNPVYVTDGTAGTIDEVVVLDSHRGRGVARNLMELALDYAKDILGLVELELTSNNSRKEAHKLYRSLGFTIRETNVFNLKLKK